MDIDQIKIEPPTVVKEELELVRNEKYEVKLENEEKPQVIEESTSVGTTEQYEKGIDKEINWNSCCYCGEKRELKEMAQTPRSEKELSRWSRLLGDKILTSNLMICRSHFNDEFGDSRLVDVVGMNNVVKTRIGARLQCCYCEKSRNANSMTQVRKDTRYFIKWVEILGQKIQKYFLRKQTGYICRSHFNVEWYGTRPLHLLPIADLEDKKVTESNGIPTGHFPINQGICVYCEESKCFNDLTMVPQNPNNLKQWGDILGPEFYQRALSKTETFICRSHFELKWGDRRPKSTLPRGSYVKTNLYDCCYCGDRQTSDKMTQIPKTQEEFSRWLRFLDNKGFKNITIGSRICRSHFIDEYGDSRLVDTMNNGVRTTKLGVTLKCCYCGARRVFRSMTPVPENTTELNEWTRVLGEQFGEKFNTRKSGYICRNHFDVKWDVVRPPGVVPCVHILQNKIIKEELEEDWPTEVTLKSISLPEYVKLEEPDIDESFKEGWDSHLICERPVEIKQEDDGNSDRKRIKLDVKEESRYDIH